jgi:hypothetical protein
MIRASFCLLFIGHIVVLGLLSHQEVLARQVAPADPELQIKEKQLKYESIPSVLDEQAEIAEPEPPEYTTPSQYDPWWITIGLNSNPFPTYDGLGNISDYYLEQAFQDDPF